MHRVDLAREIHHRVDDVHAASRHSAGGAFLALLSPVLLRETINTRAAEIALDMEQLAQAAVVEHAPDFLQRRLKAPVEADAERHFLLRGQRDRFRRVSRA